MRDVDKRVILAAVEVLNREGQEAALVLAHALDRPENEEAEAWIAGLWEPVREVCH